MLRTYLNDIRDDDAAVVVLDPKSELSRLCLQLTPPDCAQARLVPRPRPPRVRHEPAARSPASDPLPLQATAIADNIVAALLDINENQIFQSSRRYLYHAVIGAIALAAKQTPPRRASRTSTSCCCPPRTTSAPPSTRPAPTRPTSTRPPSSSAPNSRRTCSSPAARTAQRLDAPRNKVSRPHRRPAAAALLQPHQRRRARRHRRRPRHPDRRRQHGRDRRREQQGLHALRPAHAAHPAPAPGPPPREPTARASRCSPTRPTTSPPPRTSSTRSPPTAPPASTSPSACSTSPSSAPAPSTRRRSARASSTCSRAASCSGSATTRTPKTPSGSRWPSTRR